MSTRMNPTALLAVGSAVSGLLAYVFFVLVTRVLGAADAAPVSVLWTLWSFGGAAITFPIQHWTTRTVLADGGEASVARVLARVAAAVAALSLVAGIGAYAAREALFAGDAWFAPATAGVVLGSAVVGVARGVLGARRRFAAMGGLLVAENGLRCVAVALLAIAGVSAPAAYGAALLLGYFAVLFWPSVGRLGSDGTTSEGSATGALSGAAGGQILSQAVLTGAPLLAAVAGAAPAAVTALFATLALFRAPYTLSLGALAPVTVRLTQAVVDGRRHWLSQVRTWGALVVVAGSLLAAAFGYLVGPWIVRTVFGSDVDLGAVPTAVVAAGSVVAIGNLAVTSLLFAQGRSAGLVLIWAIAWVPGAIGWFVAPGSVVERATVAFLVAEVAAFVALLSWSAVAPDEAS